ncbi:MAG TPA: hypothetical protein VF129_01030 [Actinomycetota bacterium]
MESDRGRRQRIAAGVAGFAFFVGAVWLVATVGPFDSTPRPTPTETPTPSEPPVPAERTGPAVSTRVGYVGLPPEGAMPSQPKRGELVMSYFGRQFAYWYQVWVYEDGRLIWQREGNVLEGANERATGFLEQRLTSQGVELLRERRSVEAALFGFPWRPPYPASWLPPGAWEDREIRAYVPARYAACYLGLRRGVEPSRALSWLPERAAELLRATAFDGEIDERWLRGFDGACSRLTIGQARRVADWLEDGGVRQDEFRQMYGLTYYFHAPRSVASEAVLRFEPILPHGEIGCTSCG